MSLFLDSKYRDQTLHEACLLKQIILTTSDCLEQSINLRERSWDYTHVLRHRMQSCDKSRTKNLQTNTKGKIDIIKFALLNINDRLQRVPSAEFTLWFLSISFIVSFSLANVGRSLGFSSQHFTIVWYLKNKTC